MIELMLRSSVVVAVLAATVLSAPGLTMDAQARTTPAQVITVEVAHSTSTHATVELWSRIAPGKYHRTHGPYQAHVGYNGVDKTREGDGRTPTGVFTLTRAFGNHANNGTRLPYFQAGKRDWWDENPASSEHNEHVVRTTSPGGASENLYDVGAAYAHAIVVNYNTDPIVKGKGSAIFIHVTTHHATAGCISLQPTTLDTVMRWLLPADHPVVSIGVGSAAYAPVD